MAIDVMAAPHQLIASDRFEGTAVRRPNGDMIAHVERLNSRRGEKLRGLFARIEWPG